MWLVYFVVIIVFLLISGYLWRLGLQTKEECDVKKAEIELKLSKISDRVEYRLIWE